MLGSKMKYAVLFLAALAAIGYSGCILSPTEEPPDKPKPVWKDLTQKEDVITNMLQAYASHDIAHYEELLHADYLWYNQVADVQGGAEEYWQRDEEVRKTGNMFLAADQRYEDPQKWIDRLELTIVTPGSWEQVPEFNGNPCDNCWQTMREYTIRLEMNGGTTTITGNDNVQFTVVGVQKSGKTIYLLGRADDIKKP
jgi:hypothetical protein